MAKYYTVRLEQEDLTLLFSTERTDQFVEGIIKESYKFARSMEEINSDDFFGDRMIAELAKEEIYLIDSKQISIKFI